MRAFLVAVALLIAAPAHAQEVETATLCPIAEQHQFPRNTVAVIWSLRDSNDNSEHAITFTQGGPVYDPAGYSAPTPAAVTGWLPTLTALREAAQQRRRVTVTHDGEAILNITVLWSEPC